MMILYFEYSSARRRALFRTVESGRPRHWRAGFAGADVAWKQLVHDTLRGFGIELNGPAAMACQCDDLVDLQRFPDARYLPCLAIMHAVIILIQSDGTSGHIYSLIRMIESLSLVLTVVVEPSKLGSICTRRKVR